MDVLPTGSYFIFWRFAVDVGGAEINGSLFVVLNNQCERKMILLLSIPIEV